MVSRYETPTGEHKRRDIERLGITEYAAGALQPRARKALAIMCGEGKVVVAKHVGHHMWFQGLATLAPRVEPSWFAAEVIAMPTFLGRLVYRYLKAQGVYDLIA